jgi:hypothetical protein
MPAWSIKRHRAGQQGTNPDGRGDAAELGPSRGKRGDGETLEQQAKSMDERVAAFRLRTNAAREAHAGAPGDASEADTVRAAPVVTKAGPKRTTAASMRAFNRGGPVGRMQTALAAAIQAEPETEEF